MTRPAQPRRAVHRWLGPWLVGTCALVGCRGERLTQVAESEGHEEAAASPEVSGNSVEWTSLFAGVEYAHIQTTDPRPLHVHGVRVDLREPGIGFLVTPPNGDLDGETDGSKASSFLVSHHCQVAVNASPFRPVSANEGDPRDVIGLSISDGEKYSEPQDGYGVLLIDGERRARIAVPPTELEGVRHAVGGFRPLLVGGENVAEDGPRHPRTAVGTTPDGRFLILLVMDGRQSGYSEGTTTTETAEWIRRLGAHDALNLDGGGSSTLVIDDGRGGYRILNRPIHGGQPGAERVNGNHLGIFARPRPGS